MNESDVLMPEEFTKLMDEIIHDAEYAWEMYELPEPEKRAHQRLLLAMARAIAAYNACYHEVGTLHVEKAEA
jgi:hypothetical protein